MAAIPPHASDLAALPARDRGLVRDAQLRPFDEFAARLPDLVARVPPARVALSPSDPRPAATLRLASLAAEPHPTDERGAAARPEAMTGLRGEDYAVALLGGVELSFEGPAVPTQLRNGLVLARLPVMVGSALCSTTAVAALAARTQRDEGGYFLLDGAERCVVPQLRDACNRVLRLRDARGAWTVSVRGRDPVTDVSAVLELSFSGARAVATLGASASASAVLAGVPAALLALALEGGDLCADAAAFFAAHPDEAALREAGGSRAGALAWLGARLEGAAALPFEARRAAAEEALRRRCLAHEPWERRGALLGFMLAELRACLEGRRAPDDRDDLKHKRLETAGPLFFSLASDALSTLFREAQEALTRAARAAHDRRMAATGDEAAAVRAAAEAVLRRAEAQLTRPRATAVVRGAVVTGEWPHGRAGVTQPLCRDNPLATASQLRKCVRAMDANNRDMALRLVHVSSRGYLCPAETPEGHAVGLQTHLALAAGVSGRGGAQVTAALQALAAGCEGGPARLFLDGRLHPRGVDAARFCERLDRARAAGRFLQHHVGLETEAEGLRLHVWTDEGRLLRAVQRVARGVPLATRMLADRRAAGLPPPRWEDLERAGAVDWLDAGEEHSRCRVAAAAEAAGPGHTHAELHPSAMLGLAAASLPFPEHNPGPRATFAAAMAKQAVGGQAGPRPPYALNYPQRPLLGTAAERALQRPRALAGGRRVEAAPPASQEVVVAIMVLTGYNQEDSAVVARHACEFGFGDTVVRRTERVELGGGLRLDVDNGDDGVVEPGARLVHVAGDAPAPVIARRVAAAAAGPPPAKQPRVDGERERAAPARMQWRASARVEAVARAPDQVLVHFLSQRHCGPGSKLAFWHSQKGLAGRLVDREDLPRDRHGVTPDVVINPHALPTRMTIGLLYEMALGRVAAREGRDGPHAAALDATAFCRERPPLEELEALVAAVDRCADPAARLEALRGAAARLGCGGGPGGERLYSGTTGELLEGPVFMGLARCSILKHMAEEKAHARARGPVNALTRQPPEGRARDGGHRLGEMEVQALLAHGAAALVQERLGVSSDGAALGVCAGCGEMGLVGACPRCGGAPAAVETRHNLWLLAQRLAALGVSMRMAPPRPERHHNPNPDDTTTTAA